MTLRKNLQDALNEAHHENFGVVKKILAEHVVKLRSFEADFNNLGNCMSAYAEALKKGNAILESSKQAGQSGQIAVKSAIKEAMAQLDSCRQITHKLFREESEE